jgi:nucleotide-binding universal stress UspA family protein
MKNGFSVLEKSLVSPSILSTRRARLVAVQRKPPPYPSHRPLKILAPIDLSGDSKGAVEHAIEIARALGAELSLLNVATLNSQTWGRIPRKFDPALPENIGRFVVNGSIPETITSCAEFVDADLVLMTSGNYGRWKHFGKPSVTAQVVESTSRPVLITGVANKESRFHCRRILCTLALDGTDEAMVLQAEALARRSGGELILLGVVPEIDEGMLYKVSAGAARPLSSYLATNRIREIARSLSVPCKTSVMVGPAYKCIGLAARQYAADIVVAFRSELDTRAVFRRLNCPLLSVARATPGVGGIGDRAEDSLRTFKNAGDSWH